MFPSNHRRTAHRKQASFRSLADAQTIGTDCVSSEHQFMQGYPKERHSCDANASVALPLNNTLSQPWCPVVPGHRPAIDGLGAGWVHRRAGSQAHPLMNPSHIVVQDSKHTPSIIPLIPCLGPPGAGVLAPTRQQELNVQVYIMQTHMPNCICTLLFT